MLVLTRKLNEKIVIDGHTEIQVLQVLGNRVKLGIRAPGSVNIVRAELLGGGYVVPAEPRELLAAAG